MEKKYMFAMVTDKDRKLPIVVSGAGCEINQNKVERPDGMHFFQLLLCVEGAGVLMVDGKKYTIRANDFFYFDQDLPHEYYPVEEPWTTVWILFEGYQGKSIMTTAHFGRYEIFHVDRPDFYVDRFEQIYELITKTPSDYALRASGILYQLIIELSEYTALRDKRDINRTLEKLNKVTEYIKTNYSKEFTLEELAAIAEVSPSYLCRVFKKEYGMTLVSFILRQKVFEAKRELINHPEKEVKEIALELGFREVSYFGAVFKKLEGCSPNQFRRFYGAPIE